MAKRPKNRFWGILVRQYKGAWYYLGADGAMVQGLQASGDNYYYLMPDSKMATEPVTLTPDKDGALRWPGLTE